MFCKFLLVLLLSFSGVSVHAAETFELDYHYGGKHGVDFSRIPKGPLKIGSFEDSRSVEKDLITSPNGGLAYQSKKPLAEVVRAALAQGIEAGNGQLAGSGEKLLLTGDLTEFSAETKDGSIEVTVKAKVQLNSSASGSRLFNGNLFGRAQTPEGDGIEAAVSASLDKLVNSLLWDDYFLMQVVD